MSDLKARFGHEENLSRHILESGLLHQLLNRAGLRVTGAADLERPVRHGAPGAAGRLDIFQPTTAGDVVVEVQYGMSDTAHRSRFAGYAKSVVNPVAIIWIAEGFRAKDIEEVAGSKIPVMLVTASMCESEVMLKCRGGARLAVQSLDKRVAKANEKAWELVRRPVFWQNMLDDIEWLVYRHSFGAKHRIKATAVFEEALQRTFRRTQHHAIQSSGAYGQILKRFCAELAPVIRSAREQARKELRNFSQRQTKWVRQRREQERARKLAALEAAASAKANAAWVIERHEVELADQGFTKVALRGGAVFDVDRQEFEMLRALGLVAA